MKKFFFSLVAALLAATATYAQNTLVATLTHGENVSMYYGTYALRDAYNAAVSGDVINLSAGGFQPVNIEKAITLRGAGISETLPTSIVNNFEVIIPDEDKNRFIMEGINCKRLDFKGTCENPYILKCRFTEIRFNSDSNIKNAVFVNCKQTNGGGILGNSSSSAQFVNCYISDFRNDNEAGAAASFVNCVIRLNSGYNNNNMRSCQLMNCVIYRNIGGNFYSLPNTTIATNCVAVSGNTNSDIFSNQQVNPNCSQATFAEVFKDFTGDYTEEQTFELTDDAKKKYLGTDGTQVGLYGGLMPFTLIPSYPRITKMNVANKTTADGKLSVEIEVSAAQ